MAAAVYRTPDVAERQVLILFLEDEAGFFFHHRILLQATATPGIWVAVTPDFDVETCDLNSTHVVVLGRDAPLPRPRRNDSYCFDHDIPASRFFTAKNQARDLAALLGVPGMGTGPSGSRWRVSDPAHDAFGHEIPPAVAGVPDQFVSRDDVGLAVIDDVWVTVELVLDDDEVDWRRRKTSGPGRDHRLLPDQRVVLNGVQRPFMQFRDAVAASRPSTLPGWPFDGTSASNETQQALLSVGFEWMTHSI